jgi:hypothetical protein
MHKLEGEDNLIEKACKSCDLVMVLDISGLCEFCNPESFKRGRLAKQNALFEYLDEEGLNGDSTDTPVDKGLCGKERPDRVFDFGDKIVVLECDENQHKERNCVCEQTRMVNISQSFGGVSVYFIRWNPDNYKPGNENNTEDLKKRYKMCGELIKGIKNGRCEVPLSLLSVIYMYYDGWVDMSEETWKILL